VVLFIRSRISTRVTVEVRSPRGRSLFNVTDGSMIAREVGPRALGSSASAASWSWPGLFLSSQTRHSKITINRVISFRKSFPCAWSSWVVGWSWTLNGTSCFTYESEIIRSFSLMSYWVQSTLCFCFKGTLLFLIIEILLIN